jgi:hypothetical protein
MLPYNIETDVTVYDMLSAFYDKNESTGEKPSNRK